MFSVAALTSTACSKASQSCALFKDIELAYILRSFVLQRALRIDGLKLLFVVTAAFKKYGSETLHC